MWTPTLKEELPPTSEPGPEEAPAVESPVVEGMAPVGTRPAQPLHSPAVDPTPWEAHAGSLHGQGAIRESLWGQPPSVEGT